MENSVSSSEGTAFTIGGEAPSIENNESTSQEAQGSSAKPKYRIPDLAYKLARVAKKESALLEQRKALDADIALANEFKSSKEMARKDPIKLLQSLGLSFEDIARYQLEGELKEKDEDPVTSLKSEIEQMKKAQFDKEEMAREKEIEQERANHEAQIVSYKKTINDFVEGNKDDFEFLNANKDHIDTVYEIIETHYNNTQKILDFKEAAQLVEDELESEFKSKYSSLKKIKNLISPSESMDKQLEPLAFLRRPEYEVQRPTSLSNSLKPEAPHRIDQSEMTSEQRYARALEMLDKAMKGK